MSVTTFDSTPAARGGAASGRSLLARIAAGMARYRELARAERELQQLDDRLLTDIGLQRSDIRRVVWHGREA